METCKISIWVVELYVPDERYSPLSNKCYNGKYVIRNRKYMNINNML